ncbi:MAG: hypothetical protein H0T88_04600, partial [Lysobacter sp.]|nr:hypothetical protein [Lysobacter sp.]
MNIQYGMKRATGHLYPALLASAVLIALAMGSANPLLTLGSLLLMFLLVAMLWRGGEPPVLLYAMGYHWMQSSILILYANVEGRRLDSMGYGAEVESATWLTLAGVLAVAAGIYVGAGRKYGAVAHGSVTAIASLLSVRRLFVGSLVAIVLATVLSRVAYVVPGLVQPVLATTLLRWVVVYLFTYTVLTQHKGYRYLGVVFTIEILIGFLGFFSDFKSVLIVMLLAALSSPGALKGVRFRTAGALTLVILSLGIVWTGVKNDYRQFLNQGTGHQVVLVPVTQRIGKLAELIGDMTPAGFGDSMVTLVERMT